MFPRQRGSLENVGDATDNRPIGDRTKGKLSGDLARRVRDAIAYAVHGLPESPSRAQIEETVRKRFRSVYAEWVDRVPVATTRLDYIGRVLRGESGGASSAGMVTAGQRPPSRLKPRRRAGEIAVKPLLADLVPMGPADRLRRVAGSRSEPSVFQPGRRPWMFLYNQGGVIAREIELFMGPSGHVDSISAIGPGEAAELRWPGPSYHPIPANPYAKGGIVHFMVKYRMGTESKQLAGNLQLDDDGVPVLLTENPHGPQQRTTRIR